VLTHHSLPLEPFGQLPGRSHFVAWQLRRALCLHRASPDGAVYTISGNRLYAMDNLTNLSITVSSRIRTNGSRCAVSQLPSPQWSPTPPPTLLPRERSIPRWRRSDCHQRPARHGLALDDHIQFDRGSPLHQCQLQRRHVLPHWRVTLIQRIQREHLDAHLNLLRSVRPGHPGHSHGPWSASPVEALPPAP